MFLALLSAIENEQERLKIADIYEKYRYKALHIAMGITNNQQMAEDAVEDAFIDVIRYKEKVLSLSCSDLLPYVIIIVKHCALKIVNKNRKEPSVSLDEMENEFEYQEVPVDEQVISKNGYKRLVNSIASLKEKYRTVLEMKYINDMPNGEIANTLGITQKNAEMRIYRAKLMLREMLESEVKSNV